MNFKKAKENSKAAKNSKISFKKYQKENTNHIQLTFLRNIKFNLSSQMI